MEGSNTDQVARLDGMMVHPDITVDGTPVRIEHPDGTPMIGR
jgi:hypothetical protein